MASGSSAPFSFSLGGNTGTPASSAPPTGFPFGSNLAGAGFSFGTPAATTQGFSFSTPTTNTTTSMFSVPPTKPPTLGTTGIAFGTPQQTATTTQFGAAGTTTPSTGLFGNSAAGGMFGSTSATAQNTGGVGGQSASQSSGLFSGSMAQQTNTPVGGGSLPAAKTFGSTSLFSGTMAHAQPPLHFAPQNAKPGGPTFGTSTQATQSSTTTTAPPAFSSGTIFNAKPGFGIQETSTTTKSSFTFNSSTTAAASGGTPSQGSTVTFAGVAPQAKPTGMFSGMPTTAAASGGTPSQGSTVTFGGVAPQAKPTGMPSTSLAFGVKPVTAAPTMTTSAGNKLGTGTPQTAGTGFMLGTSQGSTPQMTATTLQSTGTTATSQVPGGGFKLGSGQTTSTTQLGSTTGTTATTSAPTGFTFGPTQARTQTPTQPVPNLSLSQSTTGFNFSGQLGGQAKTTAAITSATTATKPVVGGNTNLVFAAKVKSTIPGSTPLQTKTTSTTKPTLGLPIPQTSTATSTTGTGFAVGGKANGLSTTSTPSGLKLGTPATGTTATSGTTAATTSSEKYTYKQLEDQVNKWNIELEDLEKAFLEQAAQVNVTDRELMENGEKIAVLNNEVERAKAEQNRLDQELDFLISQQNELEDLLKPLEESVKQHGTEYAQEPDREREKIYTMAEKCDGQLKGMVQDLKEIIEYLNSSNANQQQEDNPVIQIAKILNVHMDSLQWIDQNSVLLQKRVDDIARLSEMRRKEHERSFRLGFD